MQHLDAVVVGGGHAGLAASQRLASAGIDHVVLERGRVGETWRSQRWDSFVMNTPSWANRLPDDTDEDVAQPADGFVSAGVFAHRLSAYAARWRLPVHEGSAVSAVIEDGRGGFEVAIGSRGDRVGARSVVVASGIQNVPRMPPIAAALPSWVTQLHSLAYRSAAALPEGAVLVVGGGQTGGQIAEDLLDAGRRVYLSPSRVGRLRRRHRGRDVFEWLAPVGFFDLRPDQVEDPAELRARQPLTSGVGRYGHTLSLQWLASRGATLVGRMREVDGDAVFLDDTVADCIRFGDETSANVSRLLDKVIEGSGAGLPPLEDDPADQPHPDAGSVRSPERLDLRALGICTVVWATGVRGEFGWLPGPALDAAGVPRHEAGSTPIAGLFVLGFPWLTRRASGIVHGIVQDAHRIADGVAARAG
jgi:putative flavoprotein involved in K+ transport